MPTSSTKRTPLGPVAKGGRKSKDVIKWEWNRKLFHSSIGVLILALDHLNIHQQTVLKVLFPLTLLYAHLDFMRFTHADWNLHFTRWLSIGMRPAEVNRLQLTSTLYYLWGVCTVLVFFERRVCILALLMLAWGDTAAAFGGRLYKSYLCPSGAGAGKTWAGSFSAFLAGSLIMALIGHRRGLLNSVMGGAVCAVGEYVDVFGLDDNFTMPIICAFLLSIIGIN